METQRNEPFRTLAGDIVDWGERFLRLRDAYGNEAAGQLLGGITEWLGGDLVDGMPAMSLENWTMLDGLAEELLETCKACLGGEVDADASLHAVIEKARGLL